MQTTTRLTLPAGGACRLYVMAPIGYVVVAAAAPADATLEALRRRGHLSALLTHDPGLTWPRARGEAIGAEMLAAGGTLAMQFPELADAMACKRRLEGGVS